MTEVQLINEIDKLVASLIELVKACRPLESNEELLDDLKELVTKQQDVALGLELPEKTLIFASLLRTHLFELIIMERGIKEEIQNSLH